MGNRPRKWIPAAISSTLILVICAVAGFGYIRDRYSPSKERADLNDLYRITSPDEAAVLVNNLLTEEKARLRDGEAYLAWTYVTEALSKRVYIDERERLLLYALPDQVVRVAEGTKLSEFTGQAGEKDALVWYEEDAVFYISATYISRFVNLTFELYEEPGRLYIDTAEGLYQQAEVSSDTQLRRLGGIKSEIVADVEAGAMVTVLDAMEDWSQVRTADGWTGYIRNSDLGASQVAEKVSSFSEPVYTSQTRDHEICLVWHQVFDQDGNDNLENLLAEAQGVNTISPTWFSLSDNEGNFTSLADTGYVETAHARGLEVWGLVDNFSSDISTYEILSRTSSRTALIGNLIQAAKEYGLDGINIDFESIKEESGPHFVQFIRELSVECRANGIVLSIDNNVPTAGTSFYDRKEQGIVADYVIIMAYDEHWRTSDAGSTSSLPFVQAGLERTLEEVPQNKVINGLPFYTRVWRFDPEAEIAEGADPLSAEYVLESTAVGMDRARRNLVEGGAELTWNEETGQYYGEYEEDGSLCRIWLEDAESIERKLDVTASFDVAGVAFWKLGLESAEVWQKVAAYMER
ncbi:MAG: hypothetical protein HFI38_05270 [Lachnospiraceae bacterium]|nr:hypothetical protein [Lachnospiraceae bacterium]